MVRRRKVKRLTNEKNNEKGDDANCYDIEETPTSPGLMSDSYKIEVPESPPGLEDSCYKIETPDTSTDETMPRRADKPVIRQHYVSRLRITMRKCRPRQTRAAKSPRRSSECRKSSDVVPKTSQNHWIVWSGTSREV